MSNQPPWASVPPPSPERETPAGTTVPPRRSPNPPPSVLGTAFRWFFGVILGLSLAIAFLFFLFLLVVGNLFFRVAQSGSSEDSPLTERHHSGRKGAEEKIAIIHVEGVILEGLLGY